MINMTSERPLYINGVTTTSFKTTEQHAKELEAAGLAQRVGVATNEPEPSAEEVRNTVLRHEAPSNRDNFEREPIRSKKAQAK